MIYHMKGNFVNYKVIQKVCPKPFLVRVTASRMHASIAKFCRNLEFQEVITWKPYKRESHYFRWINVLLYTTYVPSLEEF